MKYFKAIETWQDGVRDDHLERETPFTRANIVVHPPIVIGHGFSDSIIGVKNHRYITLKHVITSNEASSFIADIHGDGTTEEQRRNDINLIGERIIRLAEHPSEAMAMADEVIPFESIHHQEPAAPVVS